jgi:hypothetical protein
MEESQGKEITAEEMKVHNFLHGITDFHDPNSIMNISAMLMNISIHMYSMVITKEDLQGLLMHTHNRLSENTKDTVYH